MRRKCVLKRSAADWGIAAEISVNLKSEQNNGKSDLESGVILSGEKDRVNHYSDII